MFNLDLIYMVRAGILNLPGFYYFRNLMIVFLSSLIIIDFNYSFNSLITLILSLEKKIEFIFPPT